MIPYFRNKFAGLVAAIVLFGLLAGCGGGGGGGSSSASGTNNTVPPLSTLVVSSSVSGTNVLPIYVDTGLSNRDVNRLYATIRVCQPGSQVNCQTIDHVLVDTGSNGLRVLYSVLNSNMRTLFDQSKLIAGSGYPLLNCAQFADGSYAWGPMSTGDVYMGGETAHNLPMQVVGSPTYNANVPSNCGYQGSAINTAADLGANGIIGVGMLEQDCFNVASCTGNTNNGYYYTCANAQCTGAAVGSTAPQVQQLKNPVRALAINNNGVIVNLPAVGNDGAAAMYGSLVFGIGTQTNNQVTAGGAIVPNSSLNISTVLNGSILNASFIDTGSNGIYFGSNSFPICTNFYFYCPTVRSNVVASIYGQGMSYVPSVNFTVDSIYRMPGNPVTPMLSGPFSSNTFDWGLPFFFGRKVFVAIAGQSTPLGTGPLYGF